MVKRRPLEATLMIQFDLDLHEARELVFQGCQNLGLSTEAETRQDELKAECLRLGKGYENEKRQVAEVHFNPTDAAPLQYTEIYFDPAQSSPSPTRAMAPSRSKSMVPTTTTRQKQSDDYDFCKKDYNHLYPSDDDDSDALRDPVTPQSRKSPLSKLMRRRGDVKKSGSVSSDDLSFLVEPSGQDESKHDSKTWQKDVANYFADLDIRLQTAPQRSPKPLPTPKPVTVPKPATSPKPVLKPTAVSGLDIRLETAPQRSPKPVPTPKPVTVPKPATSPKPALKPTTVSRSMQAAPVPVPAALAGHKSPNSCHKTSDATHVTEASTVDAGIPSVIYCIHRDDDDDDDIGSLGSPMKSPSVEPREIKKSLLSRFSSTPKSTSPGKKKVSRSRSSITKRERENFERLYVDL